MDVSQERVSLAKLLRRARPALLARFKARECASIAERFIYNRTQFPIIYKIALQIICRAITYIKIYIRRHYLGYNLQKVIYSLFADLSIEQIMPKVNKSVYLSSFSTVFYLLLKNFSIFLPL